MPQKIAIIGAGMSGMACASHLAEAGVNVSVFDKGYNLGGRLATRIQDGFTFNHGAPGFAAEGSAFKSFTDKLKLLGALDNIGPPDAPLVGLPYMNCLLKPLTCNIDVHRSVEIGCINKNYEGWGLKSTKGQVYGTFNAVMICIPAAQAQKLITSFKSDWIPRLKSVAYDPCLTMMIAFEGKQPNSKYASHENHPLIWRQIRQSNNGEDNDIPSRWVVHASLDWSSRYLECDVTKISNDFAREFLHLHNIEYKNPLFLQSHRWRYARVSNPLGRPSLFDDKLGLGLAGDWCLGPTVENAFDSGIDAANQILLSIRQL
ncbi:MAG: Renalase [Hyphomicrobiaceae bacterium hypho_1]